MQHFGELAAQAEEDGDNEAATKYNLEIDGLSQALASTLLTPLGYSLMYDIDHLNRRQSAAVLCYCLNPHDAVQEAVKVLIKALREADIIKYLEVQMVALKGMFLEHVVTHLREKQQNEDEGVYEDDIEAEEIINKAIDQGYDYVDKLAKKLVGTMGVGKAKDDALSATLNFFRAGIDLALSQPFHCGFFYALECYVRLLPATNVKNILEYMDEKLAARGDNDELAQAVYENDARGDKDALALLSFHAMLTSGRGGGKRKKSLTTGNNTRIHRSRKCLVYVVCVCM